MSRLQLFRNLALPRYGNKSLWLQKSSKNQPLWNPGGAQESANGVVERKQATNQTDPTLNPNSAKILEMWVYSSNISPLILGFSVYEMGHVPTFWGLAILNIVIWRST
jgi:hypothetical protein